MHVVFFPSLSFSRLVSRVRDQREVRRMNTPSEEKEKRRSAERREETMIKSFQLLSLSARSLTSFLIWKGKNNKKGVHSKNLPFFFSSVFCNFFLLLQRIFSSFLSLFFSLATTKNVLLWGKGLRRADGRRRDTETRRRRQRQRQQQQQQQQRMRWNARYRDTRNVFFRDGSPKI